jgi:ergothioneine biosynthesis protein EgtB
MTQAVEAGASRAGAARVNALAGPLFATRELSLELASKLSDADQTVQSMTDASPAKWHLAHTTWFFEAFILRDLAPDYKVFNEQFFYLFNSYYEHEGERHPRADRGMLTRPSAGEVRDYRAHVDAGLKRLIDTADEELAARVAPLVELGINHEQQHQELLLTDILHLFAQSPLKPAFREGASEGGLHSVGDAGFTGFDGGVVRIGHRGAGFAYDNESPSHEVLLQPFALADRLVTNREWLAFMAEGGYRTATLWLADGWARVNEQGWQAPLYWENRDGEWWQMTLWGMQPVEPDDPVCHVSYYEAEAFARFAGKRLPREAEWEHAASGLEVKGNMLASGRLRPLAAGHGEGGVRQMFGDVWEWTGSAYLPYPGFTAPQGAVGEYNGKFMCNQMVLRGGSCATPPGHVRASYRNFFYPHMRWQFMGLRLAEDR